MSDLEDPGILSVPVGKWGDSSSSVVEAYVADASGSRLSVEAVNDTVLSTKLALLRCALAWDTKSDVLKPKAS